MCVYEAIQSGDPSAVAEVAQELNGELLKYSDTEFGPRVNALLPKLQAVLSGARDRALADNPELYYQDAVELRLLLESLAAK